MAKLHFTSTENCSKRVRQLKNNEEKIETVGILSLDDITNLKTLSLLKFQEKWNIDLNIPTILITFHPETVNSQINSRYASIVYELGSKLVQDYQLVFTMPNADTNGNAYRQVYSKLKIENNEHIHLVENFGSESYFTCMKYSKLMICNTYSGISESAYFGKYFINVGDRQKGRETGENVICLSFNIVDILKTVQNLMLDPQYCGENIYLKKNSTEKIIQTILNYLK
jgi:GDP/UDP-N,N'-diacetylbacillosamine 2-epimerase (hydrolysing)